MIGILKPARATDRRPPDDVPATYKRLRLQVFGGIFVGYAGYYLLRKNFSLAMPYLIDEGYSRTELGFALSGVSIAYGLSKLLMGSVSDRSNARFFMALGLALSAGVILISLQALDLVPKKAAGTVAGLTGLFGYFGGAFAANIAIGAAVDRFGWDGGFWLLFGSCLASVILFAVVWWKESHPE